MTSFEEDKYDVKNSIFPALCKATISLNLALVMLVPSARAEGCNSNDIQGKYGYSEQGSIEGISNIVEVGTVSADGKGNLTGTGTLNTALGLLSVIFENGSYQVNSDCTGAMEFDATLSYSPSGSELPDQPQRIHNTFVISQGGEIRFINTQPGNSLIGTARKLAK